LVGKYYVIFDKEFKKEQLELTKQGIPFEEAGEKTRMMTEARNMLLDWEARNPNVLELWSTMNGWVYDGFNKSYARMGVTFDKLYYESNTYLLGKTEVEEGLSKGVFFRKEDGSAWVDLTEDGLDEKALLRKDGTTMYITQDIGTAILRFKEFPDTGFQVYTVGNEQEYHFRVLFAILKKLGFKQAERNFHLSYGMVELPEGKMKSREGTVVDADDLMDEMCAVSREVAEEQGKLEGMPEAEKNILYDVIGMAALKYFLLKVDPKKNMLFNPKESIDFNGNTGPFIQYTYVRTQAVLRKADELGIVIKDLPPSPSTLEKQEHDIVHKLYDWPSVLKESGTTFNPSLVAHYCYDLARSYNSFYHDLSILREQDVVRKDFRITITSVTGRVIHDAMGMLGIVMPERM
jgi:arginyl-tRNA synthetase